MNKVNNWMVLSPHEQLNGFKPFMNNLMIEMCSFMPCFDVNSAEQLVHLNSFFPSWAFETCVFKLAFVQS